MDLQSKTGFCALIGPDVGAALQAAGGARRAEDAAAPPTLVFIVKIPIQ